LMFVPAQAPFGLFHYDEPFGLQLYVNRVLIKEQAEELLPRYLRFVKGVVDSPDLSLNVSREMLQQDRHVALIRKRVVRKLLGALDGLRDTEPERYLTFWEQFGRALKEGVSTDADNLDRIKALLLFASSVDDSKLTTLADYVERMPDEQEAIYFITGDSREMVERSPHLEAFRARGFEVLYLTDPVDEIVADVIGEIDGKRLQSVGKGAVDLDRKADDDEDGDDQDGDDGDDRPDDAAHKALFDALQETLDEHVKEVRLSCRLVDSPACLVVEDQEMSAHMARLFQQAGQDVPMPKRILELNADHALFDRLETLFAARDEDAGRFADFGHLLFGQACLAEGSPLPDPVAYGQRVIGLMVQD